MEKVNFTSEPRESLKAKLITREQANEIIRMHLYQPRKQVVICYKGQWYDVRGLSSTEIAAEAIKIMNL